MPKVNLGHVVGRALTWEDLTEEQKLSLKGEKGNTPEVKAGKTTIVEYDEGAKVTSETNGDVTSFNFQIPVGQRPPFYGTYENFPEIGDINRLYIDDSITPRLIYTWDDVGKKYIITSGVDSIVVDTSPENIGTYIETIGDQTVEYKMVDTHPIINGVLNKLAYFKTHASAVWYNKLAGITVLDKLNSLASNIGNISQLSTTDKTSVVKAVNELNGNLGVVSGNLSSVAEDVNAHNTALENLNNTSTWHTENIADINSKITNMFTAITGSAQYTLKAGQSISVNIAHNIPSGYKVLGVVGFYSGNDLILPYRVENSRINLHSVRSDNRTATASITVLCAKNF